MSWPQTCSNAIQQSHFVLMAKALHSPFQCKQSMLQFIHRHTYRQIGQLQYRLLSAGASLQLASAALAASNRAVLMLGALSLLQTHAGGLSPHKARQTCQWPQELMEVSAPQHSACEPGWLGWPLV